LHIDFGTIVGHIPVELGLGAVRAGNRLVNILHDSPYISCLRASIAPTRPSSPGVIQYAVFACHYPTLNITHIQRTYLHERTSLYSAIHIARFVSSAAEIVESKLSDIRIAVQRPRKSKNVIS
jgi:hypothetical protein